MIRLLSLIAAIALVSAPGAFAASHPVFSATDSDLNELPADGEVIASSPTSVTSVELPEPPAPYHRVAPAPVQIRSTPYDPVPSDQVDSLANRLRLTLEILVKSHRAYDYRVNTTHELQVILSQLDSASSSR